MAAADDGYLDRHAAGNGSPWQWFDERAYSIGRWVIRALSDELLGRMLARHVAQLLERDLADDPMTDAAPGSRRCGAG